MNVTYVLHLSNDPKKYEVKIMMSHPEEQKDDLQYLVSASAQLLASW